MRICLTKWSYDNIVTDMSNYRIDKNGSTVTIWDDKSGIGLQFTEGKSLQRYTSSAVTSDRTITRTEEGIGRLNDTVSRLTDYATELYPNEFAPLKEEE